MNTLELAKLKHNLLQEIGDLSAGSLPLKKPNIKNSVKKVMDMLDSTGERQKYQYAMALEKEASYTATGTTGQIYSIKVQYDVTLNTKNNKNAGFTSNARIDFDVKGNRGEVKDTNLNEQYKLISAVVESMIDFANQIEPLAPLNRINIFAKADEGEEHTTDSKRARLYKMYIDKNLNKLPGSWEKPVEDKDWGGFRIKRKDNQSKKEK